MAENNPEMPSIAGFVVYEMQIVGTLHGQTTQNKLMYRSSLPGAAAADQVLFSFNAWNTIDVTWCTSVSLQWALHSTILRRVDLYGQMPVVVTAQQHLNNGSQVQGTLTESVPTSSAVVMKRTTTLIGKRARGRIYIAGLPEADHSGGLISVPSLGRFEALAIGLKSGVVVAGEAFLPIHGFWQHTPPGAVTVRGLPVETWTTDPVLGNQRRRRIGRGT